MKIDGRHYRSIWRDADGARAHIIDQTKLPFVFETVALAAFEDAAAAIKDMIVRGAPLIGAVGGYGLALALRCDPSDAALARAYATLLQTRPTAVNLRWALDRVRARASALAPSARADAAFAEADAIVEEDAACCEAIGGHGAALIAAIAARKGARPINILTHCNAGWLATVDWGTALAPIYKAARRRSRHPCLGRRDPPAQSGREPYRLRAWRRRDRA